MIKPQGYLTIVGEGNLHGPDNGLVERDTITCGHCQLVVFVKPGTFSTTYLIPQWLGPDKEEAGAMCRVCMRAVCINCHDKGNCVPFERQIEEMESKGQFLRSIGL